MSEPEVTPDDPMADLGSAAWLGLVYHEAGADGLRELLEQFADPSDEFFEMLVTGLDTATAHDRDRIRNKVLPGLIAGLPGYANELGSLGLSDPAKIIRTFLERHDPGL
jgi:hypothetical protein